jgi:hypothetical protein
VNNSLDGEVPNTVLTNPVVPEERCRQADESKVVEGHHNGRVRRASTNHRRREGWEEIVNMDDIRSGRLDPRFDLSNGSSRPDRLDRASCRATQSVKGRCPDRDVMPILREEAGFIFDNSIFATRGSTAISRMENENSHNLMPFRGDHPSEEVDISSGHTCWTSILAGSTSPSAERTGSVWVSN